MNFTRSCLTTLILLISNFSISQERTLSSAVQAVGSNGSISYSIGLVDYQNYTQGNYILTQGIQQPYEFYSLSNEELILPNFKIFPNPFEHQLIIELPIDVISLVQARLISNEGKTVWEEHLKEDKYTLDLSFLTPASYVLEISWEGRKINSYTLIKH